MGGDGLCQRRGRRNREPTKAWSLPLERAGKMCVRGKNCSEQRSCGTLTQIGIRALIRVWKTLLVVWHCSLPSHTSACSDPDRKQSYAFAFLVSTRIPCASNLRNTVPHQADFRRKRNVCASCLSMTSLSVNWDHLPGGCLCPEEPENVTSDMQLP
jgi:hypothetical protein